MDMLTVADLEVQKLDTPQSSTSQHLSGKDTVTSSMHQSILKKSKYQEGKKVIFSDPSKNSVHEISFKDQESGLTESKNTISEALPTIESQGSESLKTLSMLNSEGLLKSSLPPVQNANDLRWKSNTITSKHIGTKHFGHSASEIFRQRLNGFYMNNLKRQHNLTEFNMKKPEPLIHLVEGPKEVMLVRSYSNLNN